MLGCLGSLQKLLTIIFWPRGLQLALSQKQKLRLWEKFGEAIEKDFQLDSKKFWQSWEGQLLTQTWDVIRR